MARDVTTFVRGCAVCQRTKDVNASPAGLLQPLPIPARAGLHWTMDFVTHLPLVHSRGQKFNALFVCVDKFSKFTRLVPCFMGEGELAAPAVASLFFDAVVRLFGVPDAIVSDRDPRFTSDFWAALWELLGTKLHRSSAFHPQSDGQTER